MRPPRLWIVALVFAANGCHSSISAPTLAVQPPTGLIAGEGFNQPQDLRPDLQATNTATAHTTALTYQFELSSSATFDPLLLDARVPEGTNGATILQLASRLAFGSQYYWRVRAVDTSGAASAYSDASTFTTIAAPSAVGVSLLLDFGDSCTSFFGEREFTVDGTLAKDVSDWHFVASDPLSGGFYFDFTLTGTSIVGSLGGAVRDRMGFPLLHVGAAGTTNATGALAGQDLTGSFTGGLFVVHQSFGIGNGCDTMRWTLTSGDPHRSVLP